MHFKFDSNYAQRSNRHVAMIVTNKVLGDSRVLKTAQTVSKLGWPVHVYGLNSTDQKTRIEGHPFEITLLPNPIFEMAIQGMSTNKQKFDSRGFIEIFTKHLQAELSQDPPTFVHTHDMYGLAIGGKLYETKTDKHMEAHSYRNFIWIHDIHEYIDGLTDISKHTRDFFSKIEKKFIHCPDALTSVSPDLNEILTKKYKLKIKPSLVLNAPRLVNFDPYYPDVKTAMGIPVETPLLVYIGNVKPIRGIETLVAALPFLPDVHIALVTNNSGNFIEELRRKAQDLDVYERLHFHPYVPFCKVTSFIRTANIGVHPIKRYPNAEIALPNKLFEYIHAGLPIVVSDNRSMKKFVTQYDCGLTFEADNAHAFAQTIKRTLLRQSQEHGWARSIQSLADKYSWENQEKVIADIYQSLDRRQSYPPLNEKTKNKCRIFQLSGSSAGQPIALANAFKDKGIMASSLTLGPNKFQYKTDAAIERVPKDPNLLKKMIDDLVSKYDIFHFHTRTLMFLRHYPFPTGIDLLILRAAGKKIFFHFRGSEARLASVFKQNSPYNYVLENPDQIFDKLIEKEQRIFMEFAQGVCHQVFVVDPELQTYVPKALIVPRIIDLEKWSYVGVNQDDTLKIVHAPSRQGIKGTQFVLESIERLKAEGINIEFKLVENMPQNKAKELYQWADVVIDQLRIGWYGVLAVETMALGKVAVTYIRDDLSHYLPYPLPLVIANPDNLDRVLKELASDRAKMRAIGLRGRRYVEKIHDAKKVASVLLQIYQKEDAPLDTNKALDMFSFQQQHIKESLKQPINQNKDQQRFFNKGKFILLWNEIHEHGLLSAMRKVYKYFFNHA